MAGLIALLAFGATLSLGIATLVLRVPFLVEPSRLIARVVVAAAAWATPEEVASQVDLSAGMTHAGLSDRAQTSFLAFRALLSAFLPVLALGLLRPASLPLSMTLAWAAAATGYIGTGLAVQLLRRRRQRAIRTATPAALDLLVTCLEAGLSIESAMQRVARELEGLAPALSEELERYLRDTQAGIPRVEALQRLPQRTGVPEMQALADTLIRSERGGLGIVAALRDLARELRSLQVLEAERSAAAAGPTLTVVMIVFLLPLFVVVIVGPALVQVSHVVTGP